jgi:hypothetical protein
MNTGGGGDDDDNNDERSCVLIIKLGQSLIKDIPSDIPCKIRK